MSFSDLPHLNAFLNGLATLLLLSGLIAIKNHNQKLHQKIMSTAFLTSCLFLISYLTYHAKIGSRPFTGEGWVRPIYFTILISHTILAMMVPPLAIVTLYFARKGNFQRHKKIAKITFPIWLYVSVTGVVIYWMLYR